MSGEKLTPKQRRVLAVLCAETFQLFEQPAHALNAELPCPRSGLLAHGNHIADELQARIEQKDERLVKLGRAKRKARLIMSYICEEDEPWATNFWFELGERLGRKEIL